jgi:hypothetical protein
MDDLTALMDLDGTLADYDGAITEAMRKLASPGEPDFHSFMDEMRPPWLEARRHLVSSIPGFWRSLPRLPAGFAIHDALVSVGFRIHILTKGPRTKPAAWMEKLEWCRMHVPDADVSITENKSLSYGRVLVDDWGPYFMGWLAHRPRGVVIVPAQPWNVGCEEAAPGNIFRYDHSQEGSFATLHRIVRAVADRRDGEGVDLSRLR